MPSRPLRPAATLLSFPFAFAFAASTSAARADAPLIPNGYVPIVLEGSEPRFEFTVRTLDNKDVVWQRCTRRPCMLLVPPGRYFIGVDATDDTLEGMREVEVDG